jgi:hypothetical protein
MDNFLLAPEPVPLTGRYKLVRRDLLFSYATLKFEATYFPINLVYTYQIIRRRIQGDYDFWISGVINIISKDLVNANNNH